MSASRAHTTPMNMSSTTATHTLDGDDLARVIALCSSHGLSVHAATRRGVMLELTPVSLDELPTPETLRELADALGGDGVRYVSLLIGARDPS